MGVAITGHTSGIGKALYEVFPGAKGYSSRTGYQLHDKNTRERMFSDCDSCDIFINNAPLGWNQIVLLYELWERWKDRDKLIINIGSDASDYNQSVARPYNIQKRALEDACLQMQQSNTLCKVMLIKPGYVDTPRVAGVNATKMDPRELAQYIKELSEMRNSTFWIPVVTLYPR
jgi:NADP-dependent 3-hydroxy acid dehydrogenase YdfG